MSRHNPPPAPAMTAALRQCRQLKRQGEALFHRGETEKALSLFADGVRRFPGDAGMWNNLAIVCDALSRVPEAVQGYQKALSLDPQLGQAWNNLGHLLAENDKDTEAMHCFERALTLLPDFAGSHSGIGIVHLHQGQACAAEARFRRALALDGSRPEFWNNLGNALKDQGRYDEAEAAYREALRRKTDYADAYNNLGNLYQGMGQIEKSTAAFEQALALRPEHPNYIFNLSQTVLMAGDYPRGFVLYESRFAGAPAKERARYQAVFGAFAEIPRWQGEAMPGCTLVVWTEQGFGDTLMMMRALTQAAQRSGARLVVLAEKPLLGLLARVPGVAEVLAKEDSLSLRRDDRHLPMMSLPHVLDWTLATLPNAQPYVDVDAAAVSTWKARLAALPGKKIGLVWAGGGLYRKDAQRSAPLSALLPLAAVPGVTWICLQQGSPRQEMDSTDWPMVDWMRECPDWLATAHLVSALDLVITVDTAVAHVAGAVATPVWLMNRYETEWRWLCGRDDSPWYPRTRVFRQPGFDAWAPVVTDIQQALTRQWPHKEQQ